MSKYLYGAIALMVLSLFSFLSYKNYSLGQDLAKTKEALANANTILDVQNKAIKEQELKLNEYKELREQESERLSNEYSKITLDSSKCESQIQAIENALDVFYNEHYKAGF